MEILCSCVIILFGSLYHRSQDLKSTRVERTLSKSISQDIVHLLSALLHFLVGFYLIVQVKQICKACKDV